MLGPPLDAVNFRAPCASLQVSDCLQPIVNIVPLQLLSYHLTVLRGHDVDQVCSCSRLRPWLCRFVGGISISGELQMRCMPV